MKTVSKEAPTTRASFVETQIKNLKKEQERDREVVKGIFRFYELAGGVMSFVYKKYKDESPKRYDLIDGEIYTIPLGVAKHLNKNAWYPVHRYEVDATGKAATRIGQKVRRCGFQSLEFVDTDDLTEVGVNDIVTVEHL